MDEKHKDSIRQQIRDQVNEKKKAFREEKAAWQARLDGLSEKDKKALEELKCIKYYPKNTTPDLSQVKVGLLFLFLACMMKFDPHIFSFPPTLVKLHQPILWEV